MAKRRKEVLPELIEFYNENSSEEYGDIQDEAEELINAAIPELFTPEICNRLATTLSRYLNTYNLITALHDLTQIEGMRALDDVVCVLRDYAEKQSPKREKKLKKIFSPEKIWNYFPTIYDLIKHVIEEDDNYASHREDGIRAIDIYPS